MTKNSHSCAKFPVESGHQKNRVLRGCTREEAAPCPCSGIGGGLRVSTGSGPTSFETLGKLLNCISFSFKIFLLIRNPVIVAASQNCSRDLMQDKARGRPAPRLP